MNCLIEVSKSKELLNEIQNANRIFIYGAGIIGILVSKILTSKNIIPDAFIVSEPVKKYIYSIDIPILKFSEKIFDTEDIIIVAAVNNNRTEIINSLKNCDIKKLMITDEFIDKNIPIYQDSVKEIKEIDFKQIYHMQEKKSLQSWNTTIDYDDLEFRERVSRLISHMDDKSKSFIIQDLQRIKKIQDSNLKELDVFSVEEKEKIVTAYYQIYKSISQLADNIWECEGYFLPINDFRNEIFYDKLGIGEIAEFEKYMDLDFIDVGGYIGDSALILSESTKGKVHIFEPIDKHVELIRKTQLLNGRENFIINRCAVSDYCGMAEFFLEDENFISGLKDLESRNYNKKIDVNVISLDEYVEKNHLKIGLMKIHAEGAEQEVIKGAVRTIKEQKPAIIIEINHCESDFFDIKPMLEKINPDYNFKYYKPAESNIILGKKLIAYV